MSRTGGLWGALLGGGGVAAYYNGMDGGSLLGHLLSPGWGNSGQRWAAAGKNAELDDLYKLVERLSRDVHRNQGGVTVIHGSNGSSAIFTYGGVIVVSTLGVMYLRGWKLSDFLYVTRAGLQKSMTSVTQSVEGLTQRMTSIRQFVASQLDSVKRRQEESMKAQEALQSQLEAVGTDVENTRGDVAGVHMDLKELGSNMNNLAVLHSETSEGIRLLCSVVGDLMKSANFRSQASADLQMYLKRSNASKTMGLEGLVGGRPEEQAPRMLPSGAHQMTINAIESGNLDNLDSPDYEHKSPRKPRPSSSARTWGVPSAGFSLSFSRANSSTQ